MCFRKAQRCGHFTDLQNRTRKWNGFVALWCRQGSTLSFAGSQSRVSLYELLTNIYKLLQGISWLQVSRVQFWKTILIQSCMQENRTNQPRIGMRQVAYATWNQTETMTTSSLRRWKICLTSKMKSGLRTIYHHPHKFDEQQRDAGYHYKHWKFSFEACKDVAQ